MFHVLAHIASLALSARFEIKTLHVLIPFRQCTHVLHRKEIDKILLDIGSCLRQCQKPRRDFHRETEKKNAKAIPSRESHAASKSLLSIFILRHQNAAPGPGLMVFVLDLAARTFNYLIKTYVNISIGCCCCSSGLDCNLLAGALIERFARLRCVVK
jgi:hypothetical protein